MVIQGKKSLNNLTLTLRDHKKKWNLIKNTPGLKKEWLRTITVPADKDVKSKRQPKPSWFWYVESFGYDELTAKHCCFRCSRSPDVDGIRVFDIRWWPGHKTLFFYCNVLWPDYLCQKFWSHQHQEALSTWNNNVLQWVHHDQNFQTYQNQEALAVHLFSHLFKQGLF